MTVEVDGIALTVALINSVDESVCVPLIVSFAVKVPDIVSSFKINSDTSLSPNWNLKTFSTIAVASEDSPVIVLPIKFSVEPVVAIHLNIFLVLNLPSEALNICSLG